MPTTCVSCAAESDGVGVFSFNALYRAFGQCRRRKRGTANAQRYEQRLLDHLVDTAQALQDRTYAPSRSLCFVARQPKAREIHAADFSDRVVHHLLVPRLEALFEPIFIHDVYSNRAGKGTHAAVARLAAFMRAVRASAASAGAAPPSSAVGADARCSAPTRVGSSWPGSLGGTGIVESAAPIAPRATGWFLQLDIRNFFNCIDQATLFGLINRRLKKAVRGGRISAAEARELSWLTHVILKQDFRTQTRYRCSPAELQQVPEHKRLSAAPPGKGLPIGNLTSQFFANVYLHELDQFVKHQLKCRYYLRYVDDLVFLDPEPARLTAWEQAIGDFLRDHLQLELKPERSLRPVGDGADFLGYIVRPDYRLVRRRVVGNLRGKLAIFARCHVSTDGIDLPAVARERFRAILVSYLGHFGHADSHRLIHSLLCSAPWLGLLFELRDGRLLPRWEPAAVTSLRSQVVYFRRAFAPALPLVQVGNRVVLFEPDLALALASAPWIGRWRCARSDVRSGLAPGLSWPLSALKGLGRSLRAAGCAYVFVAEEGYLPGGMKRRVLRHLAEPAVARPRASA